MLNLIFAKITKGNLKLIIIVIISSLLYQGRPQDLGGGGPRIYFFQIWEFACREATCCAWRSHAHC